MRICDQESSSLIPGEVSSCVPESSKNMCIYIYIYIYIYFHTRKPAQNVRLKTM